MGCRRIVELIQDHGVPVDAYIATGGLAHNSFFRQVLADVLQVPVQIHPAENGPAVRCPFSDRGLQSRMLFGFHLRVRVRVMVRVRVRGSMMLFSSHAFASHSTYLPVHRQVLCQVACLTWVRLA